MNKHQAIIALAFFLAVSLTAFNAFGAPPTSSDSSAAVAKQAKTVTSARKNSAPLNAPIRVVGARPKMTDKKAVPAKSVPYASGFVSFSPNGDNINDRAYIFACVKKGVTPVRATYLRWRQSAFTQVSVSPTDVVNSGESKLCNKNQHLWRGAWSGEVEKFTMMYRHGGSYWMTLCAPALGWREDENRKPRDIRMKGCAANPVIVSLASVFVERDWTRSIAPGARIPLTIHSDRPTVDVLLTKSTGEVMGEWPGVNPKSFRLNAPVMDEGDSMRLIVTAGNTFTDVPVPVRGAAPLSQPSGPTTLVVLPALTWLSYNRSDNDRNGWQDTWYATGLSEKNPKVPITAPMISSAIQASEADYEWQHPYFIWRGANVKAGGPISNIRQQVITDAELENLSAADLRKYSVVIFPGHTEYMTKGMYNRMLQYRDLGGDMMFLHANNFYRLVSVDRKSGFVKGIWPKSGNNRSTFYSDYRMVGVGYTALEYSTRFPLVLTSEAFAVPGLMDGIEASPGDGAGTYAIEFDALPPAGSPSSSITQPIWRDPTKPNQGVGAVMQHPNGAVTFATGSMLFPLMILDPATPEKERAIVQAMLSNMYVKLGSS